MWYVIIYLITYTIQYCVGSQLDIIASEDVHTVASLLKLYLRELPEPVIPFSLFDDAIRISKGTVYVSWHVCCRVCIILCVTIMLTWDSTKTDYM